MANKSRTIKLILRITNSTLRLFLNIIFYVVVVIVIVMASKKAYGFTYQIYGPVSVDEAPGRDILFQVKKGESSLEISRKLQLNKLIEDEKAFFLKTRLAKSNIMPGVYELNSSMTYGEILDIITDYSASIMNVEDEEE